MEHPYEAAFGTMASISLACGVGAATLARVADLLGYSGFAEFRKAMRANLARPTSACQAAPITSSSIEVSPARKRGLPGGLISGALPQELGNACVHD
jgi:DNA-binding MurR/RpiR family transcriptional regulator